MRLKLTIDPIPISSWGVSLSNKLSKKEWDKIRRSVYASANHTCEICGNMNETLYCHELWRFTERPRVQRLIGFECCCKICSDVHHFGRSSQIYGKAYLDKLTKHWCSVNDKTIQNFARYQREVFEISKKRANRFYTVKVGWRVLT